MSELLKAPFPHLLFLFWPNIFALTFDNTDFFLLSFFSCFAALFEERYIFSHLIICDHPTIKAAATLLPWQQVVDAAVACRKRRSRDGERANARARAQLSPSARRATLAHLLNSHWGANVVMDLPSQRQRFESKAITQRTHEASQRPSCLWTRQQTTLVYIWTRNNTSFNYTCSYTSSTRWLPDIPSDTLSSLTGDSWCKQRHGKQTRICTVTSSPVFFFLFACLGFYCLMQCSE